MANQEAEQHREEGAIGTERPLLQPPGREPSLNTPVSPPGYSAATRASRADPEQRHSTLESIRKRIQERAHEEFQGDTWRNARGQPASALDEAVDLLRRPVTLVHAIPRPEDIASNYARLPRFESLYFINGMTSTPADIRLHVDNLLRITGRPVTAIINDQERAILSSDTPGVARSVLNAFQGFISTGLGRNVERSAAQELERAMIDHVAADTPLHIVAHSQSTIILRNALEHILGSNSPLPDDDKARLKKLVRVSIYGAAEHYFPVGIAVQEYAHREDPIARSTQLLAVLRQGMRRIAGGIAQVSDTLPKPVEKGLSHVATSLDSIVPLQRAPTVFLSGHHDFASYVDTIARFFIKKHGSSQFARGSQLAQALAASINQGDLSDRLHEKILRDLIEEGDSSFAREFLHRINGEMIGLFQVPYLKELRGLAQ